MSRSAAVALGTLVCSCLAVPAPAATMQGIGTRDCEAFLRAVEIQSKEAIDGYVAWAQGYMSAWNAMNAVGGDLRVDPSSLTVWLVDACSARREDLYYQAVQSFIRSQGG